jgi:CubicO group peptidase (beta-lactamase class C family)
LTARRQFNLDKPLLFLQLIAVFLLASLHPSCAGSDYVPGPGEDWQRVAPQAAGFDSTKLQAAIDFAIAHETTFEGSLGDKVSARQLTIKVPLDFASEPFSSPIGPIKDRGEPTGIILKDGKIVAEWGAVNRVDMTFSISKTFLSSVAGIAYDQGLIKDINEPVYKLVKTGHFDSDHNKKITWDHLLRQTSGWQGSLWGKPDWADRPGEKPWSALAAEPLEPGQHWKYNDVRVNALALALLHVFREPLPDVLKRAFMDPIGASDTWAWHGYRNSFVEIDGKRMQSVSGGGHWGGGMFISARDLARLGLLAERNGKWSDKQILSEQWIEMARTPTKTRPTYGFMNWFLNTNKETMPEAPESAVTFLGSGTNMVYVDRDNGIVAVVRWIDRRKRYEFVKLLLDAQT